MRVAGGRGPAAFPLVVLVLAVLVVWLGAGNAERAVNVARGEGDPGRFTASSVECVSHLGHESCSCVGDYRSDDGSVELAGVFLAGGDGDCALGGSAAAVDIGSVTRVYHPDGSYEWITTALLILVGGAMAAWSTVTLVRARRAGRAAPPPGGPGT
ncbi:hypothetical protein [Nocardiopsis sp. NPDC006938]|uniref:hypothetical protein n=1 Tax=Nocardiopsis sp. NPDC006938 TaxID=3364337 RepID=UPI003689E00D